MRQIAASLTIEIDKLCQTRTMDEIFNYLRRVYYVRYSLYKSNPATDDRQLVIADGTQANSIVENSCQNPPRVSKDDLPQSMLNSNNFIDVLSKESFTKLYAMFW
ncbi:uncharacterized protein [Clytia hemisphaerica]|uniref:uncharacterized protein n=1 Tax=Clytia hemisphaerica TaxID=252671 RepID=UPI0034D49A8F